VLVLFDHGTPKGLIRALPGHTVHTAQAKGWDTLSNGDLLKAAEGAGVDVLFTTDRAISRPLRHGVSPSSSSLGVPGGHAFDDRSTASLPLSPRPPLVATPRSRFPST
jgi:hypothetical protein